MSEPALTFAIPYYHGARYLRRAIESVLRQTRADWRVVVCDDAGPDPTTADLVASFGDPRISYTRNASNLGLAGNWNRCLGLAETDLVTLLHSDDELLPAYADVVTAAHSRHPGATAVFTRAAIIDGEGSPSFPLVDFVKRFVAPSPRADAVIDGEQGLTRLMRGSFIYCPTLCLRRSALGDTHFDARWQFVVDLQLLVDILLSERRLVGVPDVAYAYRRHRESETTRLTRGTERFEEEFAIYDWVAEHAEAAGWNRAARVARRKRMIKLHLAFRAVEDVVHRHLGAARSKARLLRAAHRRTAP